MCIRDSGNIFDAHSFNGEMDALQFQRFATQYELTPALMSSGALRDLFSRKVASGVVGYGEFAQLVAACAMEAFPGEADEPEPSGEQRVNALMVYMGQNPNGTHTAPHISMEPHVAPASSPQPSPQAPTQAESQEVGLWQIAHQIHNSIHDLDDESGSKRALSGPAADLKQILALNRIVEAREEMMQKVVAGLEFENQVFQQRIVAAVELAQRYASNPDSIFSRVEPHTLTTEQPQQDAGFSWSQNPLSH
eukprot:TRINITY_DN7068_c0_g1_i1.p1 TRINITY_DN7068_c0_g1~~TRINITY_DN7068_c0_g1_i1.p1  ORF type:complete len:250 (-),score=38.04 TRINITY_DN7068_c0_g1_i1:54-803(-)